jgi:Protein of unknown function (DUF2799)
MFYTPSTLLRCAPRLAFSTLACAAALSLIGCASMTPQECKVANWGDTGLRDGLAGKPLSRLNDLTKDCAEAKVTVDTPSYLRGRDQGLLTYCQPDNATRIGLAGGSYSGACPVQIDGEFRRRFGLGREVFDANQSVRSADSRRIDLENRLRNAPNDEARRKLRDDLTDNDRNLRRARDRVRDAEWAFDRGR